MFSKTPLYEPKKVLYNRGNLKMGGNAVNCLKCGVEIAEGQVFCADCLAVMAKYPVKPNVAIQLPHQRQPLPQKKAYPKRRQAPRPEEKVAATKKWLRFLLAMWLITLALLIAALFPTMEYFQGKTFLLPGQNYTTITDTETTAP